ncbi:hypothetical protein B0H14DRAFT_2723398 [Mycena olivaceomarginata]|nr:hypothetical protein B0H14DRAFT_2723398 [Mycena olivaceomarginata]
MQNCANECGKPAESTCSGCKSARYCGVECQKQDWKRHKPACRSLGKPPTTHCTGCRLRFGGQNGKPDEICPDCGYVACEDCACHNRRGSCYCEDSNFGHKYCGRVPEWYHCSSRTGKVYRGDNHPKDSSHDLPADLWEKTPRQCRNCGEIELCLVPGYTCTNWLCQ